MELDKILKTADRLERKPFSPEDDLCCIEMAFEIEILYKNILGLHESELDTKGYSQLKAIYANLTWRLGQDYVRQINAPFSLDEE